ncbi:MAG TPA: twin-arginine translocase TatA/TatE family subunit [Terriglobia bacterium]
MFTGGFEFVFILFIAFLLFGPKKLPEIARVLGKGLGELRRASNDLKFSLEEEIRNLDRDAQSERQTIKPADPPAYTRERQETVLDVSATSSEPGAPGAPSATAVVEPTPEVPQNPDRQLAVSTGELTEETVTDNGHNHRDTALLEPGARS